MEKAVKIFVLILMVLSLASMSYAGKPSDGQGVFIGNGFPSGPHFNLNIIAKKAGFICPAQQFQCPDGVTVVEDCALCPAAAPGAPACQPVYGGVIFVPQEPGNDPINILMESGAKGPRANPGATSLEVTDWCTDTFDRSGASFRLPANDQGYAVYARITGDPKQNPQFDFTTPTLKYVIDESGNPLLLLGFVSGNAAYGSEGQLLPRYDSSRKGKGVQNATNITPFFMWQGSVCYIDPMDIATYCPGGACTSQEYCCLDSDNDQIYEYCTFFENVKVQTGTAADGTPLYECPTTISNWCCVDVGPDLPYEDQCTQLLGQVCAENSTFRTGALSLQVDAACREYVDPVWVFNIADFVGFLFNIENNNASSGSSVLQVRFYPLPLNTK